MYKKYILSNDYKQLQNWPALCFECYVPRLKITKGSKVIVSWIATIEKTNTFSKFIEKTTRKSKNYYYCNTHAIDKISIDFNFWYRILQP